MSVRQPSAALMSYGGGKLANVRSRVTGPTGADWPSDQRANRLVLSPIQVVAPAVPGTVRLPGSGAGGAAIAANYFRRATMRVGIQYCVV